MPDACDEKRAEADRERKQVEQVFGLMGGELNDAGSWYGYAYSYDGVPDYAGEDFADEHTREYVTVVADELFGRIDTPPGWERIRSYASSGETECPDRGQTVGAEEWRDACATTIPVEQCPLCEAEPGEEHGHVYLGDGWTEVVFRRKHVEFAVSHVDTCFPDYLTDHHNREGECLVGVSLPCETEADAAEEIEREVTLPDDLPYSEADLREAIRGVVRGVDFSPVDERGERIAYESDDWAEEQPSAWFLVSWSMPEGEG